MSSRLAAARLLTALVVLAPGAALAQQPAKAAPAAAPPKPAAPAPKAAPATATAAAKPKTAGTAKAKAAAAKAKKKQKGDAPITGPIATYPGFRLLDGGGSRVSVALSQKVPITETKADLKVTYLIQGVQVPTRNNRRPLLTTYFKTPVSSITLVEHEGHVDLVIELRQASTPQFRIVENDRGVELQVDFPKPPAEAAEDEASATEPAAQAPAPAGDAKPAAKPTKSIDSNTSTAY